MEFSSYFFSFILFCTFCHLELKLLHSCLISVFKILKKLSGKHFKVGKFKFVIHHGKIAFGKLHLRITKSTSKKFPASKGFFSFVFHKKVYHMRFRSTGMKVFTMHGKKVIKTSVHIKKTHTKKGIILNFEYPSSETTCVK